MSKPKPIDSISRRQFLKGLGIAAGGAFVLNATPRQARASSGAGNSDESPATLHDITRCVGCGNCQRACTNFNQLQPTDEQKAKLTAQTFTYVAAHDLGDKTRYVQHQCMHCVEPACVAVCTVGALHKTKDGLVICDTGKCIGCRYCQYACPFGVPTFDWSNPLGLIHKCTFCQAKVEDGGIPSCVEACPAGALRYGTRARMLALAHARIAASPDRYIHQVYGEHEVGGTTRLYISDVPFEKLGFPDLGHEAVRNQTDVIMSKTPLLALGVGSLATALWFGLKPRGHKQGDEITLAVEEEQQ